MGSLSPEAEGVEEFVVDALNNLADGSHPPPELLGPASLAGVSFGWMNDLYTIALKPPPMVFFALETLVGYIRSRADRHNAFEPGVRVSPEGEEALSQGLVGGGGSPEAETRNHSGAIHCCEQAKTLVPSQAVGPADVGLSGQPSRPPPALCISDRHSRAIQRLTRALFLPLQKGCQMQGESFHELGMGAREAIKLRTVGQGGESAAQVDLCVAIEVPLADEPAEAGKDEPIGVPEGCGALGREVGRTVGADGRGVAEALLFHHAPHLLVERPHTSLLGTLWLPFARNASPGETSGTIAGTRPPLPPDLSHQRRVDDHVPKRLDRGHVGGAEQPVRLEQDRHLPPVAARPVWDPAEVHDCVDGPVGHLSGELVFEQVERGERVEVRAGRGVAQVLRQPVAERRYPGAQAGVRAVPAEQLSDLPPERPESAGGARPASRRIARADLPHQPREVVRAARRRQRPHVLQPEVAGDLVDAPGPGGVRGVREPHSWTSILGILPSSESPANIYQESL